MLSIKDTLEQGQALTDAALERLIPGASQRPASIHQAMRHSVFAGGKRLRPILVLLCGRLFGDSRPMTVRMAAVVEMIHHWDIGFGKNYFYYHNPDNNSHIHLPLATSPMSTGSRNLGNAIPDPITCPLPPSTMTTRG